MDLWRFTLDTLGFIVQVFTLLVLYLTLIRLREYTKETKRFADVAVEDMSRPCILIVQHRDPTDEATIADHSASITGSQTLCFSNAGTALAINVRYRFQTTSDQFFEVAGPPLVPGEVFVSNCPCQSLADPAKVAVEFESLGGGKCGVETVIENRRWVKTQKYYRVS